MSIFLSDTDTEWTDIYLPERIVVRICSLEFTAYNWILCYKTLCVKELPTVACDSTVEQIQIIIKVWQHK